MRRKIGILTFHRSMNYGAFLQCFALSGQLRKDFPNYDVEVIDYSRRYVQKSYLHFQFQNCLKHPSFITNTIGRNRMFSQYHEMLPLSKTKLVSDDLLSFDECVSDQYDAIVVGSDVVWGIDQSHFPSPYWLHNQKCKKFSYAAASHGTRFNELSDSTINYCAESLKSFQYIGVRDDTTMKMIRSMLPEATIYHNCDPTILLDLNEIPVDINSLKVKLENVRGYNPNKKTIGVMLSDAFITKLLIDQFSGSCNIVSIYTSNPFLSNELYNLNIFEWSRFFSLFDLTITTFFHGTLFSIKNNTPVVCVNIKQFDEKIPGKTQDILNRLGMQNQFFNKSSIEQNACNFISTINTLLEAKPTINYTHKLLSESYYYQSFYKKLEAELSDSEDIR